MILRTYQGETLKYIRNKLVFEKIHQELFCYVGDEWNAQYKKSVSHVGRSHSMPISFILRKLPFLFVQFILFCGFSTLPIYHLDFSLALKKTSRSPLKHSQPFLYLYAVTYYITGAWPTILPGVILNILALSREKCYPPGRESLSSATKNNERWLRIFLFLYQKSCGVEWRVTRVHLLKGLKTWSVTSSIGCKFS